MENAEDHSLAYLLSEKDWHFQYLQVLGIESFITN